jgi:hypothetical protein
MLTFLATLFFVFARTAEEKGQNYTCHMKVPGEVVCLVEGSHVTYENKADEVVRRSWYTKITLQIGPTTAEFWIDLAVVLLITLTSGAMSGLTIGLMGMDLTNLEILHKSGKFHVSSIPLTFNLGTPEERANAGRVLPLVRKHHLTLVTLLLMNAAAMEALPVCATGVRLFHTE